VPRAKAAEQGANPRGDYEDYEEENAGYNSSALLYIYDSVSLDKSTRIECVNFVKGKSFWGLVVINVRLRQDDFF